jgi:hypothetical protein
MDAPIDAGLWLSLVDVTCDLVAAGASAWISCWQDRPDGRRILVHYPIGGDDGRTD